MEEKNKNDEFRRILWVTIVLAVGLIWLARPLIIQENAYRRVEGEIVSARVHGERRFWIRLDTDGRSLFNVSSSQMTILQEKAVVGKGATIWYSRVVTRRNNVLYQIRKMKVDNEVIIPFSRTVGLIFVVIIGSFFVACIIYIIKHLRQRENQNCVNSR